MGWVINLKNKYSNDIFFRTEFNVICLQISFAIVLTLLVSISFNYLYKDILQTIIGGINENIKNSGSFTSTDIVDSIQLVRAKNFLNFFSISLSMTLVFSYIIARMTLYPTRNALKSQKRFISDIAHEIRTPISVIKTNSEVALLDNNFNSRVKSIFKSNIEELDRVSAIINNLLTFNNLVHPEQIKFVPVNMASVLENSIKKLDDLIKRKEIKLTVKKTSPFTVKGNIIALEQIATNIIKNAINYNNVGGSVSVMVGPDYSGNIVLSVEDNGIGIAKDDLIHIFEPFYRAERSRTRQSGSSGLGLTIVSELVKLHSGRVSVSSQPKIGTKVTVTIPYSKADLEKPEENKKYEDEISIDFLKRREGTPEYKGFNRRVR